MFGERLGALWTKLDLAAAQAVATLVLSLRDVSPGLSALTSEAVLDSLQHFAVFMHSSQPRTDYPKKVM